MPLVKLSQNQKFDSINTVNRNLTVPDSMWSNSFNFHFARENEQQNLDMQKKNLSTPVEKSVFSDCGYPIEPRNNVINSNTRYETALQTPFTGLPGINFSYPGSLSLAPNSMIPQPPITGYSQNYLKPPQQPEDMFGNTFDNQLTNFFMQSQGVNNLMFPTMDSVSPEIMMVLAAQQQILSQIPAYSENHMLSYNNMINQSIDNINSRRLFVENFLSSSKPITTVKSPVSDNHGSRITAENHQEAILNGFSQLKFQNQKSSLLQKNYLIESSIQTTSANSSNSTHIKQTNESLRKTSLDFSVNCKNPTGLKQTNHTYTNKNKNKKIE